MVSTAVVTPARTAVSVPAPVFKSSGQLPAHGMTTCITGGARIPPSQKKVLKLVSTLEIALEDKDHATTKLIKKHEADLHDRQRKYDAMYAHCTALAKDLRRKEALLECLKEADRTQKTLSTAQQQLARSTMPLPRTTGPGSPLTGTSWSTGPLMILLRFCRR